MSKNKDKKSKKIKLRDEFRKVHNKAMKGHPAYVNKQLDDSYEYYPITHGKRSKGVNHIELERSPNPKDKSKDPSYLVPRSQRDKIHRFSKTLKDWRFTENDKNKVNQIIKQIDSLNAEKSKKGNKK